MKIQFWSVGKAHDINLREAIEQYTKRLKNYFSVEWHLIPVPKNSGMMSELELKKREAEMILNFLKPDDYLVVLDERGKIFSSEELANFIQQRMNESVKTLVFLIGGVYGIGDDVLKRANFTWSLSKLVFPHQITRLILAEQVYRAATILKNEKYHHA